MNDPVWSVIIMVILAMFGASYAIWAVIWEAYAEKAREEQKKNG
jgi:hypothetical protein